MSLWELLIISLVALIVVGPKRIPELAYTASRHLQKARTMVAELKGEFETQLKHEQLKENQNRAEKAEEVYREQV